MAYHPHFKRRTTVAKAKKQQSGGKRLGMSGRKAMLLGWAPDELEKIREAAKLDAVPMTQFVMNSALRSAEKKLAKSENRA